MPKLSKQRRVYALLLGLGLTALAVDKVLLPPAGAGAAMTAPEASPAPPQPEHAAAPSLPPSPPQAPLAQRLALAAGPSEGPQRDGFTPAKDWVRLAPDSGPAAAEAPAPVQEFAARHRMTMIVWGEKPDGSDAQVFIGGRNIGIGGTLDGYTLKAIEQKPRRRAVFESSAGTRVELTIAAPGQAR